MKKTLLLMILLFTALSLQSQEYTSEDSESDLAALTSYKNDSVFIISDFIFDIKGRTRPDALIYNGEFKKGEIIEGKANLEKYINDKIQMLINQRVLKDNVEISYSIEEAQPDGIYPVILTIKVEDSWNIIALPYPYYNSNTGFELTIKARDYNFFGTMNALRVDLGYSYLYYSSEKEYRSSFLLGIDSNTPFTLFGYTWTLDFDNYIGYRANPKYTEPVYYQNVTGLSMELPVNRTTFTFGFQESFNVHEEIYDRLNKAYFVQTGLYMSSKIYTNWKIPMGLTIADQGELTYTPEISATFNHDFPEFLLPDFKKGPFMNFNHTLGFGKIDWISNYRKGYSVWLYNTYSYDFFRLRNEEEPLSITLSLNGTGHYIISDFFAISARLRYRYWWYHSPNYFERAGDMIRGVGDDLLCADHMISLNMDFPFRVLVFELSKWTGKPKLGFFDFELQISPVVDLAYYNNPGGNLSFAAGGGVEFIVFSAFMRNLYACLSLSWDIKDFAETGKLPSGKHREITFGLGHFY